MRLNIISKIVVAIMGFGIALPTFATTFNLKPSSSGVAASNVASNGTSLVGLTLLPGQSISFKCQGSVNQTCKVGSFIVRTNYKTAADCPKSSAMKYNCARFDNNWKIASIYSDRKNNGVVIKGITLKGGYTYPLRNISNRPLTIVME